MVAFPGTPAGIPDASAAARHAAQLGFMRAAQFQQSQQQQQAAQMAQERLVLENKSGIKSRIRDVWKHNLAQEMATLRSLVEKYPYISMVCSICVQEDAASAHI